MTPTSATRPNPTTTVEEVIDLQEILLPDGTTLFTTPDDVELREGRVDLIRGEKSTTASQLPQARLAGNLGWEEVGRILREQEQNGGNGQQVELAPGGKLVVVEKEGSTREASTLPQERLAALKPWIEESDTATVRTIDPSNVEGWTPVFTPTLDGWRFSLKVHPDGFQFVFVAFRSPNESGQWRLWVLSPNADECYGHKDHMVSTMVGSTKIPVLCGPGGRPANSLQEARLHAGKWAAYTQAHIFGQTPAFSL